jgi:putative endonuclease
MFFTKPIWRCFDKLRQWHDARTMDPSHALGRRGEDLVHRFLEAQGYDVIQRNWRSRSGLHEIDLIAWERGIPDRLVVIEVKSRRSDAFASPDRNVDRSKEIAVRRAAREFCRKQHLDEELVRFDTVAVVFEPQLRIEHNVDAFSWQAREDFTLLRHARTG